MVSLLRFENEVDHASLSRRGARGRSLSKKRRSLWSVYDGTYACGCRLPCFGPTVIGQAARRIPASGWPGKQPQVGRKAA
jgi:hypothetical protein